MKPHKHAELIKAWADGAEIQYRNHADGRWLKFRGDWEYADEYRINPDPKPDVVILVDVCPDEIDDGLLFAIPTAHPNLKLTFDGETGELKSAEVLK